MRLILCLPASSFSAGCHTAWHAHDKLAYEAARYSMPALFQCLTKAIPLFLSYTKVVILWEESVHALLEVPPEVLNWVKIW
jgi:hypothetical protein